MQCVYFGYAQYKSNALLVAAGEFIRRLAGNVQERRQGIARLAVPILATVLTLACSAPQTAPRKAITASGTIDAETVAVASQYGGRVQEILADEGDSVSKEQVLIRLDAALIAAQIGEAEATVLAAQAQLDQVKAGAHPEEIRAAEAALAQAIAQRKGAKRGWENARAIMENPQELMVSIDQARTAVGVAKEAVEQAEAQLHAAKVERDGYENPSSEYNIAQGQVEAAEAALEQARAEYAGAQQALHHLLEMRANPIEMAAEVHAAQAAYYQAEAAVDAAQAQLDLLKAGPAPEEVAAAEANVKQAQAALDALQVQRDKMTLRAPVEGLVISRSIEPGEIASPSATLLRLADLDRVKLTVFVPETQIASVHLGQPVEVAVDAYPDRRFKGAVLFIAHEAEFTPRNVQTQEQRANLVFAVKVSLDNPEHLLKPGMPADATLLVK
ncbi:MAG: HlyD family secretion protein [Anaerolineae bacterium]